MTDKRNMDHNVPGNIYVSLTTIPPRIKYIEPVIAGWINQTIKPTKIFLNIPNYSSRYSMAYELPEFLLKNEYVGILELIHCEDFGPSTKIIPVVQRFINSEPDCMLIYGDDEWIYSPDSIENFLLWSKIFPDSALALRGGILNRYRKTRGLSYNNLLKRYRLKFHKWGGFPYINGNEISEPREVQHLAGWKSCLVKPRFFNEELWNYSAAPKACFFVDDAWISAHLFRNNVVCRVIPGTWPLRLADSLLGEDNEQANIIIEESELGRTGKQYKRNKITWEYILNSHKNVK